MSPWNRRAWLCIALLFPGVVVSLGILFTTRSSAPIEAGSATSSKSSPADAKLAAFFENPDRMLRKVPGGFRIIALSNLAESCASQFADRLISRDIAKTRLDMISRLASSRLVRPYKNRKFLDRKLGHHGLYLSHLSIVLAAREAVHRDRRDFDAHHRVVLHLASLSKNAQAHAPSFPETPSRWPADQSALLYALWLFDQLYEARVAQAPIEAWLRYMQDSGISANHGLPVSELNGTTPTSQVPRGCALSFMIRYMSAFAPDEANMLWTLYTQHFSISVPFMKGLREYPTGVAAQADIDSGPIVMGVGAAATGIGISAARAVGDSASHASLQRTMSAVYALAPDSIRSAGESILAISLVDAGQHLNQWVLKLADTDHRPR